MHSKNAFVLLRFAFAFYASVLYWYNGTEVLMSDVSQNGSTTWFYKAFLQGKADNRHVHSSVVR